MTLDQKGGSRSTPTNHRPPDKSIQLLEDEKQVIEHGSNCKSKSEESFGKKQQYFEESEAAGGDDWWGLLHLLSTGLC